MASFDNWQNGKRVYVQIPLWVNDEPEHLRPVFAAYLLRWQLFGVDDLMKKSAFEYFKKGHETLPTSDIYYIIKRFVEEGLIERIEDGGEI